MRSAGKEPSRQVSSRHLPLVDRAQTVHVLVRVHGVSDLVSVNLLGRVERHLNNDPVYIARLIQLLDLGQQLRLGGGPGQLDTGGLDPNQLGSFQLHSDVDIAVLATSDLSPERGSRGREISVIT